MEPHLARVYGPLEHFSIQSPEPVLIEDPGVGVFENDLCFQLLIIVLELPMGHPFRLVHRAARRLALRLRWNGPGRRCLKHNGEEHR